MRTSTHISSLRFAVIAFAALLMSACGGGGSEPATVSASALAKPTADLSRLASVAAQCGVSNLADLGSSGQIGLTTNRTTLHVADGPDEVVSYLASGNYFDTQVRMDILMPLSDLRIPDSPAGSNTMGVAMTGPYLLGSIGCIRSVGKIRVLDDNGTHDSIATSWVSVDMPSLPMSALLPKIGINGFEYLSNFTAENPSAVFDVPTENIHDPENVDICRLESASTWSCVPASHTIYGLSYRFSAPMSGTGVYVLSTPVAQD
jgi:hypothetical protein